MIKKIAFIANILFLSIPSIAQNNEGVIHYETTVTFGNFQLDNIPEDLAARIPKESKSKNILYFNAESSLYESEKSEDSKLESASNTGDGMSVKFVVSSSSAEEKYYVDITNKKIIQQREIMGKKFLIEDKLEKMKWKATGRQKMLLNYPVLEAMAANEKDTIYAWYTTAIPITTGPAGIGGLPGLILEASIGKRILIQADSIALGLTVSNKIKAPTKGKPVSKEQFVKIVKEKEEEMKKEMGTGNGSNVIIKSVNMGN